MTATRRRRWASSASAAWRSRRWSIWRSLLDGIPLDQVTTSMTINSPAAIIWAMYIAAAEKRGIPRRAGRHDAERHPEGVHRAEGVPLPARSFDAAGDGHDRVRRRARCRSGTRSVSPATTSARRARPRRRSWLSPWPTASPTSRPRADAAWRSTTSRRGSRSSSTSTTTSSRRSPSSAPRGASGRGRCARSTGPRIRVPGCSAPTRRLPASA